MKKTLLLLSAIIVFAACKKNKQENPEPITIIKSPSGSIAGKITRMNAEGDTAAVSPAGIKVAVEGQNAQAITNAAGQYTIENVNAGILRLIVSCTDGSGTVVEQVSFEGNETKIVNATVYSVNNDILKGNLTDTVLSGLPGILIRCVNSDPARSSEGKVLVAFSNQEDIDLKDTSTYRAARPISVVTISPLLPGQFLINEFYSYKEIAEAARLKSGDTFFVKVFPISQLSFNYNLYEEIRPIYSAGIALPGRTTFIIP